MFLEKAFIMVLNECKSGGISFKKDEKISVQFNPEKYSISSSARYNFSTAKDILHAQYRGRNSRQLKLDLFYDMLTEETILKKANKALSNLSLQSVLEADAVNDAYVNKIMALTRPNEMSGADNGKPPMVEFKWGNERFKGVITDASLEYALFNSKGEPTRATIRLTISECDEISSNNNDVSKQSAASNKIDIPAGANEAEVAAAFLDALKLM